MRERQITEVGCEMERCAADPARLALMKEMKDVEEEARHATAAYRRQMEEARLRREETRRGGTDEAVEERLRNESRFMKAELRRMKRAYAARLEELAARLRPLDERLERLRTRRRLMSDGLQEWLFRRYEMLNARGERRSLPDIFATFSAGAPPAGTGDCCAPKLLQYAYLHQLHPVCMAEFWWGASPKNELRRHGYYYPACRTKCEPILKHMLEGLEVDPNPLALPQYRESVRVVWEDDYLLVVDKPAGMLSVPGKDGQLSVWEWMRRYCPQATGPLVVHRLDMATSGLLLLAKTKEVHAALQAQFETRAVKKRYVALLDGEVSPQSGFVRLPLCPDPDNRPRQLVSEEYGKPAVTRYEVMGQDAAGHTRIALYPLTGRTHQLRVHAAHPLGLDAPIVGDALYGHAADRLYLHAEKLEFCHPVTGHWIKVEQAAMF